MDTPIPVAAPLPVAEALHELTKVSETEPVSRVSPVTQTSPQTESALVNKFPYVAIWILAILSLVAALQFSYAFTVPLISAILLHYALGKPVN